MVWNSTSTDFAINDECDSPTAECASLPVLNRESDATTKSPGSSGPATVALQHTKRTKPTSTNPHSNRFQYRKSQKQTQISVAQRLFLDAAPTKSSTGVFADTLHSQCERTLTRRTWHSPKTLAFLCEIQLILTHTGPTDLRDFHKLYRSHLPTSNLCHPSIQNLLQLLPCGEKDFSKPRKHLWSVTGGHTCTANVATYKHGSLHIGSDNKARLQRRTTLGRGSDSTTPAAWMRAASWTIVTWTMMTNWRGTASASCQSRWLSAHFELRPQMDCFVTWRNANGKSLKAL